jgi:transposase
MKIDDRVFVCINCGYVAGRDYNAANNLAQTKEDLKINNAQETYRELHRNTTPVNKAALAWLKTQAKLPWLKQAPYIACSQSVTSPHA